MDSDENGATNVQQRCSTPINDDDALSIGSDGSSDVRPETMARRYQLEVLEIARSKNTIVYLETGCGKTLIAVLLLKAFTELVRHPQQGVSVFLVPTRNLVFQQANVIMSLTDLKVGQYSGTNGMDRWQHGRWDYEIENYEVLVMTPQILLNNLHHSLMKMEMIKLLIFDECHHCQKEHPYACIMKEFYHEMNLLKRPRIFGMTASPIIGKGGYSEHKYGNLIHSLESMLDSKIYTVRNRAELELVVVSPSLIKKGYSPLEYGDQKLKSYMQMLNNLVIKHSGPQVEAKEPSSKEEIMDASLLKGKSISITKAQRDLQYCIYELGLWCTKYAAEMLLQGDLDLEHQSLISCDKNSFLQELVACLSSLLPEGGTCNNLDMLESSFVSTKVVALVEVLSTYWEQDTRCIVFVERIITARVLAGLLGHFKSLKYLRCKYLTGCQTGSKGISKKLMHQRLEDFRSGKVNLLVATNVAEEGLDIQSCSLIVRFDLPKTVCSFIQSRGRARKPGSKYVVLLESENSEHDRMFHNLTVSEDLMQEQVQQSFDVPLDWESTMQSCTEKFQVERTGATIPVNHSIALLHHFCSSLPKDEFYNPAPRFSFISLGGEFQCEITLPVNSPIRRVVGCPCSSILMSKKVACLEACKILHAVGALTDNLLPWKTQENTEDDDFLLRNSYKSDMESEMELYGTVVPNVLLRQRPVTFDAICLHAYFISFYPIPNDRPYADFALFLELPLPTDAANLTVELQLVHGRTVISKLVPSGKVTFDTSQVKEAENFQMLLFGIMLDRKVMRPAHPSCSRLEALPVPGFPGHDRWYLLLPVAQKCEEKICNELQVNWQTVNNVLTSSLGSSSNMCPREDSFSKNVNILHLANGMVTAQAALGALVRTTHTNEWFCIVDVLYDVNANNNFPYSTHSNYADYFKFSHGVTLLHPDQPMLKAKPLKKVQNLLSNRSSPKGSEPWKEMLVELPPELCSIEIFGLSADLINAAALLPSFMHRLENILVASQLRDVFSAGFREGSQVSLERILEALTTENCGELFSLERLELLGDSFLKFAVSCHLFLTHDKQDEGFLSMKRQEKICNSLLYKRGVKLGISVFIRGSFFYPSEWVAPCHPCRIRCDVANVMEIHGISDGMGKYDRKGITCCKGHRWIQRKTIADAVEALIGAYLVDGGRESALAFMKWVGLEVEFEKSLVSTLCNKTMSYPVLFKRYHLKSVEKLLGYTFSCSGLLLEAFTHASFDQAGSCYQRLEFLGDAVLDYLITQYLYTTFNTLKPGQLTDLRSATVNNEKFARVAVKHHLEQYLLQNSLKLHQHIKMFVSMINNSSPHDTEILDEWDGDKCPKVLGDIVESLAGAVLVDTDFNVNKFWDVFEPLLHPIVTLESLQINPIRELSELCQKHQFILDFDSRKLQHAYLMEAKVTIGGEIVIGSAEALDKKSGRRKAARDALRKLKHRGFQHSCHSLISYFKNLNNRNEGSTEKLQRGVDLMFSKEVDRSRATGRQMHNVGSTATAGSQNSFQVDNFVPDKARQEEKSQMACMPDEAPSSWLCILPFIHSFQSSGIECAEYMRHISSPNADDNIANAEMDSEQKINCDSNASSNLSESKGDAEMLTPQGAQIRQPLVSSDQAATCEPDASGKSCEPKRDQEKLTPEGDKGTSLKLNEIPRTGLPHSDALAKTSCNLTGFAKHRNTSMPAGSIKLDKEEAAREACIHDKASTSCLSNFPLINSSQYNETVTTKHVISISSPSTVYGKASEELIPEKNNFSEAYICGKLCNRKGGNTKLTHAGVSSLKSNMIRRTPSSHSNALAEISCSLTGSAEHSKESKIILAEQQENQEDGITGTELCSFPIVPLCIEQELEQVHIVGQQRRAARQIETPIHYSGSMNEVTNWANLATSLEGQSTFFPEKHDRLALQNDDSKERYTSAYAKAVPLLRWKLGSELSSLSTSRQTRSNPDCFTTTSKYSQGQPRSELYEICAKHNWTDPIFTCLKEEGMAHNKLFIYTVTITLPGVGVVEGEGEPMKTAKLAMDTAAVNLLLWLRELHYI